MLRVKARFRTRDYKEQGQFQNKGRFGTSNESEQGMRDKELGTSNESTRAVSEQGQFWNKQ